jgi:hypothetical protein
MKDLGIMRKNHTLPIFAVLALAISFSVPGVYAQSITPTPTSGSVGQIITLSGSGLSSGTTFFICVDSVSTQETVITDVNGAFVGKQFLVPPGVSGSTTINLSNNANCPGSIVSVAFTVNTSVSIPEFPFSFSLVIIFVAVAAVYIVIRQKMTTSFFKPF